MSKNPILLALQASTAVYEKQARIAQLQREADEFQNSLKEAKATKKAKSEKVNVLPNQTLTTVKAPTDGVAKSARDNYVPPVDCSPLRMAVAQRELPVKGTITGKQCIAILLDLKSSREDRICAIAGYIGYDRKEEYASQEYQARLHALREVRKAPALTTLTPQRHAVKADSNITGYAKGTFVPNEKLIADLEARECLAASEMSKFFNLAKSAKNEDSRLLNEGLAALAEERVQAIREDLFELRNVKRSA